MILRYDGLNVEYDVPSGEVVFLTIESPRYFDDFTISASSCGEMDERLKLHLIEESNELDFHKNCLSIVSPDDLEFTSANYRKKLYNEIAGEIQTEAIIEDIASVRRTLLVLAERIAINSQFNLDYDDEYELKDLFSLLKISVKNPKGIFAERLIEYIYANNRLFGYKFCLIVNCDDYLEKEDYMHIKEFAAHEDVAILCVNGHRPTVDLQFKEHIIDKDLCEI